MRKWLWLFIIALAPASYAQINIPAPSYVRTLPSTCGNSGSWVLISTGAYYVCFNGVPTLVGGSGGSGTVSSGTATDNAIYTGATTVGPGNCTDTGILWSCSEPISGTSLIAGTPTTAAKAALPTGSHGVSFDESSTAGVPASAVDYMRANATTHQLMYSINGGAETALPTPSILWTVTTPAVTCYGGTPSNVTIALSTGTDSGKTRYISSTISVTSIGTCDTLGAFTATLPFTARTSAILICRETSSTGYMGQGQILAGSNSVYMAPTITGQNWGVNGYSITCSGVVQAQ